MTLNRIGSFGADREDYMRDPDWQRGYALLGKYGLHFEMQIYDQQIPDAVRLAKKFSDIPIVLEHLGWPMEPTLAYLPEWRERLARFAELPNTFLKISCLGWLFKKSKEEEIFPYLKEALRLFGVERCVVGSNCPPDSVYLSFGEIFYFLKKALSNYPEEDQQKVFYGNAIKIYRL